MKGQVGQCIICLLKYVSKSIQIKNKEKDVGSGNHNRHSPSSNSTLNAKDRKGILKFMISTYASFTEKMTSKKKTTFRDKLQLFADLQKLLSDRIPGIADVRSMHLIVLSALVGILPLEFYIYVPMHYSCAPKKFLDNEMDYQNYNHSKEDKTNQDKLLSWTANEMKELQLHFSKNFTPNMLENTACIISRTNAKKDVFYCLPWYDHTTNQLTAADIQLCFRLKREETRNVWKLEAFDGKNTYCFLHSNNDSKNIIQYCTYGHEIVEKNIVNKEQMRKLFQ